MTRCNLTLSLWKSLHGWCLLTILVWHIVIFIQSQDTHLYQWHCCELDQYSKHITQLWLSSYHLCRCNQRAWPDLSMSTIQLQKDRFRQTYLQCTENCLHEIYPYRPFQSKSFRATSHLCHTLRKRNHLRPSRIWNPEAFVNSNNDQKLLAMS